MARGRVHNVLFLCTGNSARSVMAEVLLNELGGGRFRAFSAGSHPVGKVHPFTIEALARNGYTVTELRSKSWDEFAAPGAPRMDFVITVCDAAAGEACPVFFGAPVGAHWGVPDPVAPATEPEQRRAFADALTLLRQRVQRFTSLPFESVDARAMGKLVSAIAGS